MLCFRAGLKTEGCRRRRGFTLVEVLVVLTIIGILIATTVPSYIQSRPARLLGQTANNMAANLNYARTQAIKDNAPTYVEFLPEIDMYRIWDSSNWDQYAVDNRGNLSLAAAPLREIAPQLRYRITPQSIAFLERNYSNERAIASYASVPDDVDIRMQPYSCVGQPTETVRLMARNGFVSREPLMFIKYFPDGRAANSWSVPCSVVSTTGIPRLVTPNLEYSQITLQVRGGFNGETALDFLPNTDRIGAGDTNVGTPFPRPITPNQSLPYAAATSDSNGRRILLNHGNGRVAVEAYAPYLIDLPAGEDLNPDWRTAVNNKEWI
ncbi:MAG: hypothetical protein GEEBNDBF_00043 [bacterium]|nr:hypothetical protein [bacterium]